MRTIEEAWDEAIRGTINKGGSGSGNFGHKGRPGKKGGSGKGGSNVVEDVENPNYGVREEAIRNEETQIALNTQFETGILFTPNGVKIISVKGGSNYVNFADAAEKYDFHGWISTHNHPHNNSFSGLDIRFAHHGELREERATCAKGTFRFYRDDYKPFDKEMWNLHIKTIYAQEDVRQHMDWEKRIEKGKMTIEEAESTHFDVLWRTVTDKVNEKLAEMGKDYRYVYELKEW